ncbi:MAG: lytic transglycosylase domain-containing protein, partial [Blastocatellia bacterium]
AKTGRTAEVAYYDIWRDKQLNRAIQREAGRHHLDPLLIHAVVAAESAGHRWARSRKGAGGPMQLMPATARRFGVRNRFDPDQAVRGGTDYLSSLLNRYNGNVILAVAAYNAGERNVDRYGAVPPFRETRDYVRKIAYRYQSFVQEYRGANVALSKDFKGYSDRKPISDSSSRVAVASSTHLNDSPGIVVFSENLVAARFVERPAVRTSSGYNKQSDDSSEELKKVTRPRRVSAAQSPEVFTPAQTPQRGAGFVTMLR